MYTNFNRETLTNPEASTKYTEYLKTFDDDLYGENPKAGRQRSNRHRHDSRHSQPLQSLSNNEVKFSNIFSPNESNALKLQLMQKTASLPLLDPDSNNNNNSNGPLVVGANGVDDVNLRSSRRRSTASGLVHVNGNNTGRKGESVTNILYSTIRHGHEYDNPSTDDTLHTGSDSKVDYDPHEPLPAIDQIALRHELLNNIRAISRATYFEDLYTGKVRRNSGSPEAEIFRLLENAQGGDPSGALRNAATIPSKDTNLSRVDRWVKESSEASSRNESNDTDEEKGPGSKKNTSLYHQTMWNDDKSKREQAGKKIKSKGKKGGSEGTTTESPYTTAESDAEAEATYKSTKFLSTHDNDPRLDKHFGAIKDKSNSMKSSMSKTNIPSGMMNSPSQYLQSKYLGSHNSGTEVDSPGKRRPFSFGLNGSDDIPLSVSLPNVAQTSYRSTPVPMHDTYSIKSHSTSRPENLSFSTNNLPTKPNHGKVKKPQLNNNNNNAEQVRRGNQPKPAQGEYGSRHTIPKYGSNKRGGVIIRPSKVDKVPGIYARLNMNQFKLKKVWFYVNGDEHFPRFEYRFRHGKDIRDMDQLLDLLTKRFPTLPTGARFIFTIDGYLINSLEELVNENSYVVSSTRKFKTLKYGNGGKEGENGVQKSSNPKSHQRLSKRLSTSDGALNSRGGRNIGQSEAKQNLSTSSNSKSVSDVPNLVAHVIEKAAVSTPSFREPIRIINGLRPSLMSQVLLNTRTSQPFEDLVRDLAMSVKMPKQPIGNALQTLSGRQIRSYSQLRSELKAGQRTFYVYTCPTTDEGKLPTSNSLNKPIAIKDPRYIRNRNGKPMVKAVLGKTDSNSSSELVSENQPRRKSQIPRRSRSNTDNQIRPDSHSRYTISRSPTPDARY